MRIKKPKATLENLSVKIDGLTSGLSSLAKVVTVGFFEMRKELAKKADKTDIVELKGDIANLATSTKLGFDEVHDKIDNITTDIKGVKQRLTNIDNRLDNVATHERRILRLEKEAHIV